MISAIPRKQAKNGANGLAFENGVPVLATGPDWEAIYARLDGESIEADAASEERQNSHEVIRAFLHHISQGTPKEIGRRVLLAAYDLKELDGCRTQRQLAKRMQLTPGRVSQILNTVKRDSRKLGRYF